jgi:hypothetical protein
MEFDLILRNGLSLVVITMAMVEFLKKLNLTGNRLILASFSVGVVLGVAYAAAYYPMNTFQDWFEAVMLGLFLGLVASGAYDLINRWVKPEKG